MSKPSKIKRLIAQNEEIIAELKNDNIRNTVETNARIKEREKIAEELIDMDKEGRKVNGENGKDKE